MDTEKQTPCHNSGQIFKVLQQRADHCAKKSSTLFARFFATRRRARSILSSDSRATVTPRSARQTVVTDTRAVWASSGWVRPRVFLCARNSFGLMPVTLPVVQREVKKSRHWWTVFLDWRVFWP